MAGHSKWANIKHKKAREDAKRGQVFTKIVKKISTAARRGGGDPETNPELRMYVQKAKEVNMPSNNIERAILKATGQLEGVTYTEFTYEGYGPGGVAIFLEGATDNKNRTVGNVRHFFDKYGGNLGNDGCVAWMFSDQGIIVLEEAQVADVDALMELALDNGATDITIEDGMVTLTTEFQDFIALREALQNNGYTQFVSDELTKVAENSVTPSLEDVKRTMKIIELLEEDDDVESVYHNLELSDEVAAALEAEG